MCLRASEWTSRAISEVRDAARTWFGSLKLSTESQHLMVSRARQRLWSGGTDFDMLSPNDQFTERMREIGREVTLYLKRVRKLFGHTNTIAMMGCEVGEVLYVGFSAQYRAKELWSITHNFAIAENLVWNANDAEMKKRLTIGTIELTDGKKAWEYLWVAYEKGIEATVGVTVDRPRYAVVQQVYPEGNLKLLGV